ncbi:MAG: hypothetical protein UT63_C0004G0016 [Candidatus Gottesmanbacteria bacterium GW2011_GWC2_39_8]|uniref:MIP18 family-like domain-containing protein n=1 Tax=Candidatus Gottesmanbacteria bacterium GW2011_GWC2_39_8 TaxID=1618450 RepID=A0A0G0Q1J4_9BACT|nr:MAG: hypothetical protein UT63_C0004G0016 [Candidatus Gottesmanbacteria bacterium GW2011_GWC2_39_8]
MITKQLILKQLEKVPDPELNISIVDLGLVYDAKVDKKNNVEVVMTLTSMGCPLFSQIEEPIKAELGKIKGIGEITVELTFEPPWTPERMSEKAKAVMGFG